LTRTKQKSVGTKKRLLIACPLLVLTRENRVADKAVTKEGANQVNGTQYRFLAKTMTHGASAMEKEKAAEAIPENRLARNSKYEQDRHSAMQEATRSWMAEMENPLEKR
jgi:hypothetical protein